jgi:hypothetical protein
MISNDTPPSVVKHEFCEEHDTDDNDDDINDDDIDIPLWQKAPVAKKSELLNESETCTEHSGGAGSEDGSSEEAHSEERSPYSSDEEDSDYKPVPLLVGHSGGAISEDGSSEEAHSEERSPYSSDEEDSDHEPVPLLVGRHQRSTLVRTSAYAVPDRDGTTRDYSSWRDDDDLNDDVDDHDDWDGDFEPQSSTNDGSESDDSSSPPTSSPCTIPYYSQRGPAAIRYRADFFACLTELGFAAYLTSQAGGNISVLSQKRISNVVAVFIDYMNQQHLSEYPGPVPVHEVVPMMIHVVLEMPWALRHFCAFLQNEQHNCASTQRNKINDLQCFARFVICYLDNTPHTRTDMRGFEDNISAIRSNLTRQIPDPSKDESTTKVPAGGLAGLQDVCVAVLRDDIAKILKKARKNKKAGHPFHLDEDSFRLMIAALPAVMCVSSPQGRIGGISSLPYIAGESLLLNGSAHSRFFKTARKFGLQLVTLPGA